MMAQEKDQNTIVIDSFDMLLQVVCREKYFELQKPQKTDNLNQYKRDALKKFIVQARSETGIEDLSQMEKLAIG
jgi:hypothetical protein